MELKGSWLAGIAAALVLAGLVLVVMQHRPATTPKESPSEEGSAPVAAGDKAADFKLEDLTGKTISLTSLKGKVIFLNFWATWCGPCREEMPSMETLYDEFKSRKDFVMIAVS